jgi:hypothetical protein
VFHHLLPLVITGPVQQELDNMIKSGFGKKGKSLSTGGVKTKDH